LISKDFQRDVRIDENGVPLFLKKSYICVTVVEIILHEGLAPASGWPTI
jgi:hypothetical protein